METITTPSIEEARSYIYSIDFSNIIRKLINQYGWARKHAEKVCQMYRNFLFLQKKYGESHKIPPSEEMDEFWHMHILDTGKYRHDCERIFGKYLDHYPYFGIDDQSSFKDLEDAFEATQSLYAKEFDGDRIEEVRAPLTRLISFLRKFKANLKLL